MKKNKIKCVVWDLDNTLWDGILVEDSNVSLKTNSLKLIKTLDERGILQSISSKNDYDMAFNKLKEFKINDYFIYPQISWSAKSNAVENIAKLINIGIDTLAFVDDQEFEREEVAFKHPQVLCIDASQMDTLADREEFTPEFITDDSKKRRILYLNDIKRKMVQEEFKDTEVEFLKSLDMEFTVKKAQEEDLKRVEELMVRTHQLNTTGYTYSYDELKDFIRSDEYEVLIAQLDDKYGEYGKIGIALIHKNPKVWELKLMLMSCRVMSRGVGTIMLNLICRKALENGVKLFADFIPTDRNRMMFVTFKFNGFKEINSGNSVNKLEYDAKHKINIPDWVKISADIG